MYAATMLTGILLFLGSLAAHESMDAEGAGISPYSAAIGFEADYPAGAYRSRQNGNWQEPTTWERFNGTDWVNATAPPQASNSTGITIRNTHAVTINAQVTVDELVVEAGGILTCNSTLTLADGPAEDLYLMGKMTLSGGRIQGAGSIVISGTLFWGQGTIHVASVTVYNGGRLHLYTSGPKALEKN